MYLPARAIKVLLDSIRNLLTVESSHAKSSAHFQRLPNMVKDAFSNPNLFYFDMVDSCVVDSTCGRYGRRYLESLSKFQTLTLLPAFISLAGRIVAAHHRSSEVPLQFGLNQRCVAGIIHEDRVISHGRHVINGFHLFSLQRALPFCRVDGYGDLWNFPEGNSGSRNFRDKSKLNSKI